MMSSAANHHTSYSQVDGGDREDDDDNESIIVYGDFTSPDRRWSPKLLTTTTTSTGGRTRTTKSSNTVVGISNNRHRPPQEQSRSGIALQVLPTTPSRILRRHDRRNKRHYRSSWKRHHLFNQQQCDDDDDDDVDHHRFSDNEEDDLLSPPKKVNTKHDDDDDPFASLECFMDKLSQEKNKQCHKETPSLLVSIQQQGGLPQQQKSSGDESDKQHPVASPQRRSENEINITATATAAHEDGTSGILVGRPCGDLDPKALDTKQVPTDSITDAATSTSLVKPNKEPYVAPSPPDFDVCVHDDHDYADEQEEDAAPSNRPHRVVTQQHILQQIKKRKRSLSFKSTSLKERRGNELSSRGKVTQPATTSDSAAAGVKKVKSIVGLRPATWVRSSNRTTSPKRPNTMRPRSLSPIRPSKASVLAAATRKPRGSVTSRSRRDGVTPHPLYDRNGSKRVLNTDSTNTAKNQDMGDAPQSSNLSLSFAPSFVPVVKSSSIPAPPVDALIEDPTRDEDYVATIPYQSTGHASNVLNHSPLPQTKRRRSSKVIGKWGRRLEALCHNRGSDVIRLRNQAYARHAGTDVNNPRKRARCRTDITILAQKHDLWGLPDNSSITILCYVHSHTQYSGNTRIRDATLIHQNTFAWITFKIPTARTVGIDHGRRIRIYNSILLPCPKIIDLGLPAETLQQCGSKSSNCEHLIVCTDLCEEVDSESS